MSKRNLLSVIILGLALGGCGITAAPQLSGDQVSKLASEKKAIVLMHVAISGGASQTHVRLARRDDAGGYRPFRVAVVKFPHDPPHIAGQLTLDPGEYGVVEVSAMTPTGSKSFQTAPVRLDGIYYVYDRPIATFKVGAGEVVDTGSLHLIAGPTESTLFETKGAFTSTVGPLSATSLEDLRKRNPQLATARIARPMILTARPGA